ncbi:MAG: thiamine pyrophosphate-dependent enzyme, partial [Chloroflexota bacterium]
RLPTAGAVTQPVCSPPSARSVMRQMLALLPETTDESRLESWWEQIGTWQQLEPLAYERSNRSIKPQFLCEELAVATRGKAIVTTDVGQHQMWLAQYYPFREPRQSITSGGLGTMGFGLPAAIGAQLAFPNRQVVAFVGDGGFQMTAQELSTAVHYGTNTKVVIMNNRYLGMVRQWQEKFYDRRYSAVAMDGGPDFVKLAEAYGAKGLRVSHPAELRSMLEEGLSTPGVVVMDVTVTQEENVFPMVPPGAGLKEMVLR